MKLKLILIYIFFQSLVAEAQISDYPILKPQFKYEGAYKFEKIQLSDVPLFKQKEQTLITQKPVPMAYSYDHLAFFCKLEVRMEKATKLPIKFRLGDVQYMEKLEGKPYSPFLIDK
jgi:hypothetical protein